MERTRLKVLSSTFTVYMSSQRDCEAIHRIVIDDVLNKVKRDFEAAGYTEHELSQLKEVFPRLELHYLPSLVKVLTYLASSQLWQKNLSDSSDSLHSIGHYGMVYWQTRCLQRLTIVML